MNDNYKYYADIDIIDCHSFKACYQVCRQLTRHGFIKACENCICNTRFMIYEKNETEITVYIYNELTDPLSRRKISFIDYISKLAKRYTQRYK